MTVALSLIAWALAVPAILVIAVFALETLAGLVPLRPVSVLANADDAIVVIVPAHDEAIVIARSLAALTAVLPATARVLVVADNCTDETARIARDCGVDVVERTDPDRRGKGYALAFARDVLAASPPDAVVVVDADCAPAPGTIAMLGAAAVRWSRPVQAVNLLRSPPGSSPMVQVSSFAFLVKNLIRQRGAARLADVGILGGTGMAVPWALFADAPLASSDIVEDLSLGIWATRRGHPPRLVEGARVESDPAAKGDTLGQRTRWEHGFLQTARKHAPRLIGQGIARSDRSMLWLGLHLCVPPLALLVLLVVAILAVHGGLAAVGATVVPLLILGTAGGLAGIAILLAWIVAGRGTLSAGALVQAPLYVLWKLPVYLRLLGGRTSGWRRTPRPGEGSQGRPVNRHRATIAKIAGPSIR